MKKIDDYFIIVELIVFLSMFLPIDERFQLLIIGFGFIFMVAYSVMNIKRLRNVFKGGCNGTNNAK